jgi:enoyl-[acyl-carrier protein] reductase II
MRVKRNDWTAEWERKPHELKPFPLQRDIAAAAGGMDALGGKLEGLNPKVVAFAMGQGVGMVREILPAGEVVRRTVAEAEAVMGRMGRLRG